MKTVFGAALAAMLFLSAPYSSAPNEGGGAPRVTYQWTRAILHGSGLWPESCSRPARGNPGENYPGACLEGGWPRAIVPVEFRGEIWMVQDANFSWRSPDGMRWSRHSTTGAREERYGAVPVVFRDRIFLLGGTTRDWQFRNDVWVSSNGVDWTRVTPRAEWSPRRWHAVVAFAGKLWLLGGSDQDPTNPARGGAMNDVWVSDDGAHWTRIAEPAPWSPRSGLKGVVFQNQLWVIGGDGQADAWTTTDGRRWTQVASHADWPVRRAHGIANLEGKLWLFGGLDAGGTRNDVWHSADGATWRQAPPAPWSRRTTEFSLAFGGRLWLFGGKTGRSDDAGDVWVLGPG